MWKPWYSLSKADREAITHSAHAAVWVWIALFTTSFIGWLGDLLDWLSGESHTFPDPGALVTAAAAAIVATVVFFLSTIVKIAQSRIRLVAPEQGE